MRSLRTLTLVAEGPADSGSLQGMLDSFTVAAGACRQYDTTYYDTFDWRLFRDKKLLQRVGRTFQLYDFNGNKIGQGRGGPNANHVPADIADPELGNLLAPIIEMRALTPAVTLNRFQQQYNILNEDRKTVARISVQHDEPDPAAESGDGVAHSLLTVREIRGYEGPFERIFRALRASGLIEIETERLAAGFFAGAARQPLCYRAKFRVELAHDSTIGGAVADICLYLLDDMEENRDGICRDIDSEFLHDFRIAVRRTRSLFSLSKQMLPLQEISPFSREFKWLGRITGPLRDIDVYLLERTHYLELLPPRLGEGMRAFFDELAGRRQHEVELVRRHLRSPRYEAFKTAWRAYLTDPNSSLFRGKRGGSCRDYSDALIRKRFKGLVRDGNRIGADSRDEALHALRIKGKKFRYLLEFFKSFYSKADMNRFLKQMKKLQDNLGDFNDLSVQQRMLGKRLDNLRAGNQETIGYAAALGGLLAVLAKEQLVVRNRFQDVYDAFSTTKNEALLERLVTGKPDGGSPKRAA